MVGGIADSHGAFNVDAEHEFLCLWMCIIHLCCGGKLRFVLDFDKFRKLSDKHNEIKLALEAVCCAIHVQALQRLSAGVNEVVNNLDFDLEFMLEDRSEERQWYEALFM